MIIRRIRFVLLLLLLTVTACAEEVNASWMVQNVHGPSQIGIADSIPVDLNQDGLMDVVSVSLEDGHLRAYINQGGLVFEQQYLSTDVLGAFRLSATDFNNDGQTDFLIPSVETQEIIALIADDGAENFGYRKQIIAENILLPTDARATDLNRDGLIDVVSVSFESNTLSIHIQNEAGGFVTKQIGDSIMRPRKLLLQDFDNDDWPDILVSSSEDNSVRLFSNKQGMDFNSSIISNRLLGVREMAICDQAGADFPDFVVSAAAANSVTIFSNLGDNTFNQRVIDDDLPGAGALHCADIDNDQDLELISISAVFGNIYTQEITGPAAKNLVANSRDGYIRLAYAEFGNDSLPRVLTQSFFENRNLLYDPLVSNTEHVVWEDFPDGAYFVETGDMDNDGDEDIVYAVFRQNEIYLAEKTAGGYQVKVIFDGVEGPQSLALADADSDGDIDIVSAGAWDDTFWMHENVGNNVFNTTPLFNQANNAARVLFADLNGDGLLDVVGTSSLDDSVRWFKRTQTGYEMNLIDDQADGALPLTATDYDNDGDQDLVVGNFFGSDIVAYTNSGSGQFTKNEIATNKTKPTSVLAADIDGDLDVDLIYNSAVLNSVWLNERVVGQFEKELLVSDQLQNIQDVKATDFNHDGLTDLVTLSPNGIGLSGFINQAANEFTAINLYHNKFGGRSLQAMGSATGQQGVFVTASNTDNSIKIISLVDLVFQDDFE